MFDFDLRTLDTQRIGRMGELVVELELLARGWMVGNFNATTSNSVGWDLFATRGRRSVKIRVKAKRPGIPALRWSARPDSQVLAHLDPLAVDDFVAAVSFEVGGLPDVYLLPSAVVEDVLSANHRLWLSGRRRDGGERKDSPLRHVYLDDRLDLGPAHGYAVHWRPYRGDWEALEGLEHLRR